MGEELGNDFVVAGAHFFFEQQAGHRVMTDETLSGSLMHELGHTLGLRHGGGDYVGCKPNYISVMNYTRVRTNLIPERALDYSRMKLPTLDERHLNEAWGLQGEIPTPALIKYLRANRVAIGAVEGTRLTPRVVPARGAIDWTNDTPTNPFHSDVAVDANDMVWAIPTPPNGEVPIDFYSLVCAGGNQGQSDRLGTLEGYDDWDNLFLNFREHADTYANDAFVATP
jgi:hypothetical protein